MAFRLLLIIVSLCSVVTAQAKVENCEATIAQLEKERRYVGYDLEASREQEALFAEIYHDAKWAARGYTTLAVTSGVIIMQGAYMFTGAIIASGRLGTPLYNTLYDVAESLGIAGYFVVVNALTEGLMRRQAPQDPQEISARDIVLVKQGVVAELQRLEVEGQKIFRKAAEMPFLTRVADGLSHGHHEKNLYRQLVDIEREKQFWLEKLGELIRNELAFAKELCAAN